MTGTGLRDWGSKAGIAAQVQGPRLSDRDGAQGLGLKGRDCGSGTGAQCQGLGLSDRDWGSVTGTGAQ